MNWEDRGPTAELLARKTQRVRVDGKHLARGDARFLVHGVTYGPFAPNEAGEPFPSRDRVREDLRQMREMGANAIRTYFVPPDWLLELAEQAGVVVLVDIAWTHHHCFLDSVGLQREARQVVRQAAEAGRGRTSVLAYSIANEIAPDVIRWHGARRVERFLSELADIVRQTDPAALTTYGNFPPTEFLQLPFLDFATFNVYLHNIEPFRRYLARLQNLVGDRPLLLGEIGMDTMRQGEAAQAEFLEGHLREAALMGLAGSFVFSWTDDWVTGGHRIEDWAFGLTRADRTPKPAFETVGRVFRSTPAELLSAATPELPRVSVVVCSYNGAATLDQCLLSLERLDYPDYEVILVDDGSTDSTPEIAGRHPGVYYIRQANHGLSVARNTGLNAASGAIVAYTDSDCYADANWLAHLVYQLQRTGAHAVGGPNLTPDDGWLAACVGASPGQPTHVLESDQVAEHIPGCNMAFRREALQAVNGFSAVYRKAGDDVDLCWRLEQAGMWITFAPGAFVWHHRRQTPKAYLRQQAGYGEAEALLWFDHPDRFNLRGEGKWRGAMYGGSGGLRLGSPVIYRGVFATGLFQALYAAPEAHWASVPATLEWHAGTLIAALIGVAFPPAWIVAGAMLALSLSVAAARALSAPLKPGYGGMRSRCVIAALSYLQPLVRSWSRIRARLFPTGDPRGPRVPAGFECAGVALSGKAEAAFWSEEGRERTELLRRVVEQLTWQRWPHKLDGGWCRWDVEVHGHPWTALRISTAQEAHAGGTRLVRVRYRLLPSEYAIAAGGLALLAVAVAFTLHAPSAAVASAALAAGCVVLWTRGLELASHIVALVDTAARQTGFVRCAAWPARKGRPVPAEPVEPRPGSRPRHRARIGQHPERGPDFD